MLAYLVGEHLSPEIERQMAGRRPEIRVVSVNRWRGGALFRGEDEIILTAAAEDAMTLVTFDQKTIRPLLVRWAASGMSHAGVVFVDGKTLLPNYFGGIIRGLTALWDAATSDDWTNRVLYMVRQAGP